MKISPPTWRIVALLSATLALPATAKEQPVWEVGLGAGVISFPEYRGSARQRTLVLPAPYLVYRSKFLRTDRGGLRGMLFDSDKVELNLSFSASLPVRSDSNGPRRGMPNLRPTIEFGPSLVVSLWRNETQKARLDALFPVRAAYTITGGTRYTGLIFAPALNFNTALPGSFSSWNFGALAGPIFANARQHRYFYEVRPRYALPDRPAYRASGGYSGSQFVTSLSRRFDDFWVGGFLRYDTLHGAVFADSPLVKRQHALFGGVGVTWIFGKSDRMVDIREKD